MARQKFLNKNFPSMNMTEEEKKKAMADAAAKQAANTMRKSMPAAAGELEIAFIDQAINSDVAKIKKLLEEENK
jgi:hypothetical protein|tara:strand:- start:9 stop:230 length:222 start_codon:yes stop_codon:yes gene_type:complete